MHDGRWVRQSRASRPASPEVSGDRQQEGDRCVGGRSLALHLRLPATRGPSSATSRDGRSLVGGLGVDRSDALAPMSRHVVLFWGFVVGGKPRRAAGKLKFLRRVVSILILAVLACLVSGIGTSQAATVGTPTPSPSSRILEPGLDIALSAYVIQAGSSIQAASVTPCRGTVQPGFKRLEAQLALTVKSDRTGQSLLTPKRIYRNASTGAWTTRIAVPKDTRPGLYNVTANCIALSLGVAANVAGEVDEEKITTFQSFYVRGPAMITSLPRGISLHPGSSLVLHVRNDFVSIRKSCERACRRPAWRFAAAVPVLFVIRAGLARSVAAVPRCGGLRGWRSRAGSLPAPGRRVVSRRCGRTRRSMR